MTALCKCFVLCLPLTTLAAAPARERVPIDLVICLDTSGSMTQLIDSARGRIWDIVTELSTATPTPALRVGLLTYGTPEVSTAERGWVVRQIDLTADLDTVYARMMALTTEGGDEFVGWVLDDAVSTMSWSTDRQALRLIYVAGNESADQGADRRNFRTVAETARQRGILINAVYAGGRAQGVGELWDQVASHGGGDYAAIDMAVGTLQIASPFDDELNQLNRELNATYIPFGPDGQARLQNLLAQDTNASRQGAQSCGSRVAAKGCALYDNASWDLVDASSTDGFDWAKLDLCHLPSELHMNLDQLRAHVAAMREIRGMIRQRITAVGAERTAWLQAETRRITGQMSLDDAMRASLRRQASAKGFAFPAQLVHHVQQEPLVMVYNPPPQLSPGARVQLDQVEARLPAMQFTVRGYRTAQLEYAQLLARKTGQPITYRVGDHDTSDRGQAEQELLEDLEQRYTRMTRLVMLGTDGKELTCVEPHMAVSYVVGGVKFGNIVDARFAHEQVTALVKEFEARPSALKRPDTATCGGAGVSVDVATAEYDRILRVIARTAAEAFTERGC